MSFSKLFINSLNQKNIKKNEESGIFDKTPNRIVVIGDLHGDWDATVYVLKVSGLIKQNGTRWVWNGRDTYVVQMGDQFDRLSRDIYETDEASETKIMFFLDRLDRQARKEGGRVISILGNHEIMNVLGDFSYVSEKSMNFFGGPEKRLEMCRPGSPIANYFANNRYSVLKLGPWLFVHGSITPHIASKYTIPEINNNVRKFLRNERITREIFNDLIQSSNGIFWSRMFAQPYPDKEKLDFVLKKYNSLSIMLGHTPQDEILSKCNHKIWLVDVGLSKAFGKDGQKSRVQVLEILTEENKPHRFRVLAFKNP